MDEIYILKTCSNTEEYIRLTGAFSSIKSACYNASFQHLTHERMIFGISDECGLEIPDVIYQEGVLFVSGRLKENLVAEHVDYVFFKQADVISDEFGIHETFWIMVPPRIECLDLYQSDVDLDWDFDDGLVPMMEARSIRIISKKTGRYEIFKLLGIMDNNVYIKNRLCDILRSGNYEGMDFIKLQ